MIYKWVSKHSFRPLKAYLLRDIRKGEEKPSSNSSVINQGIVPQIPSSLANVPEESLPLCSLGPLQIGGTQGVSGVNLGHSAETQAETSVSTRSRIR